MGWDETEIWHALQKLMSKTESIPCSETSSFKESQEYRVPKTIGVKNNYWEHNIFLDPFIN